MTLQLDFLDAVCNVVQVELRDAVIFIMTDREITKKMFPTCTAFRGVVETVTVPISSASHYYYEA